MAIICFNDIRCIVTYERSRLHSKPIIMKAYFIIVAMLLGLMPYTVEAQGTDINSRDLRGKVVYQDDEVVFRQLDEHTWIGNGHRVYNESLYIVEGNERALLIDVGTYIPDLDKIVAKITSKPVTMMLTHAHGDHVGGVGSNGNNGGNDMMVDDKGVRINFSSRTGMK